MLGVSEQETVGILVHFAYFPFDTAEQTQLVEVLEGEV